MKSEVKSLGGLSKHDYWENHLAQWQESGLSKSKYTMHSNHRLFHALMSMFEKYNFRDIRHLKTLANMASGLIQSQSSCLTDCPTEHSGSSH